MKTRAHATLRSVLVTTVVAGMVLVPMTPAFAAVFIDGFESGTTVAWSQNVGGVTVETAGPFAPAPEGTKYAQLNTTGASEYLLKSISNQSNLYVDAKVNVGTAPNGLTLIRLTTTSGGQLVSLKIDKNGKVFIKNHVSGGGPTSSVILTKNAWHELELHATVNGASSLVEVWLDGTQITALTSSLSLGTTPVGAVQLGNRGAVTGGFVVGFDAVTFDTVRIGGGGTTPPEIPTNLHEVSHTDSTASIAWNPVSGATLYGVYRGGIKQGPDIAATSFNEGGLSASTPYSYTVDAFNSAGRSLQTAPLVVTTDATPPPGGDVVVRVAGDIACDPADVNFNNGNGTAKHCQQKATSDLLVGADNVFALGDTQYVCGGTAAYQQSYDPSWGRFKSLTWAIPADQEYEVTGGTDCSTGAAGYFGYYGLRGGMVTPTPLPGVSQSTIPGVYSFNLPEGCTPGVSGDCTWHVVGLLSVCSEAGGCDNGSPMENWLDQDLTANSWAGCTAVMLHIPRFSSKANGNNQINNSVLDLWQDFVAHGVEFVLSGNSHYYERFGPQDALGNASASGTVQWIVGTGGRGHGGLAAQGSRLPNSEAGQATEFGVLDLTLRSGSYDWDFLPIAGTFSDPGSRACV